MHRELKHSRGTETACRSEEPQDFFWWKEERYFNQKNYKIYLISQISALCWKTQNWVIDWQRLRSVFLGNTSFTERNSILRICSSPCFSGMKISTTDTSTGKDTLKTLENLETVYQSNCTADLRYAVEAFEQKYFKANSWAGMRALSVSSSILENYSAEVHL